jgi:L-alanine-DL-glutamate epimerase-like enolase superfamily enzyme
LSSAACIHLAAGIPNSIILEYGLGPFLAPDLFKHDFKFQAPYYEIPHSPGLGIDVDESKLEKYPSKPWITPRLRRPDGSFNNW